MLVPVPVPVPVSVPGGRTCLRLKPKALVCVQPTDRLANRPLICTDIKRTRAPEMDGRRRQALVLIEGCQIESELEISWPCSRLLIVASGAIKQSARSIGRL